MARLIRAGSVCSKRPTRWDTFAILRTSRSSFDQTLGPTRKSQAGPGDKIYVVQTLHEGDRSVAFYMTTDPGDLVLDPTCGSGTTAYVAEQWGRRWITIDTSRVALALARARIMGARYPYYLLADSRDGQRKEAEVSAAAPGWTSLPTAMSVTASSMNASRTSR